MPAVPTLFPDVALAWLIGDRFDRRVLTLTGSAGLPRMLADAAQHATVIDKDFERIKAIHDPRVVSAVARAEALPFRSSAFDVVIAPKCCTCWPWTGAPELARVLRPGGWVGASQMVRDDSVPWVRRLIELMRSADPNAMGGDFGQQAVENLLHSKYFPRSQQADFRVWVPISRHSMLNMAASQKHISRLSEPERAHLLDGVGAIFDGAARGGELLLPYQLKCWRAYVDHAELTTPISLTDDALIIPL